MSLSSPVESEGKRSAFPKSSRLLKSRDFKFGRYKKLKTRHFHILVGEQGSGRLGISISKKVLKRAVWRNRVRRLLKEAFRTDKALPKTIDLHFIAQPKLREEWESLKLEEVQALLNSLQT